VGNRQDREDDVCRVILVVSADDTAVAELAAAAAAIGYRVQRATSVEDAQSSLAAEPPGCLVVDASGPATIGLAALIELHAADRRVPLVALVDADEDMPAVRGAQAGIRDYLVKGRITEGHVARVVANALAPAPPEVDPLTGLPGRSVFFDRVAQAMRRLGRRRSLVGMLIFDVNDFRLLNASYGTEEGDRTLIAIARRLQAVLRPSDTVTRLGSDQFALLCDDLADEHAARAIARRVRDVLTEPFPITGQSLHLSIALGVAVTADPSVGIGVLVRQAQEARRTAKQRGSTFEVADPSELTQAAEDMATGHALRQAAEAGELRLFFQPKVAVVDRQPVAVEALLRWAHPERGLLEAHEFVELADVTGAIVPIGRWVLGQAAAAAALWRFPVSVNVSGRELRQPGFADLVADALTRAGCRPEHLRVEVPESALVADAAGVVDTAWALRAIGVDVTIDNVGVGGASLAALRRVPATALEVDRTVIDDLELCAAIVGVAHALGMSATLEGVEAADQVAAAEELGFDVVQGWHVGPPGDASGVPARLRLN
jgi:diguanylate cyclase (GGDEF)-like protein